MVKQSVLPRNGAYGIVMRGVHFCTCAGASLRDKKALPLCCIIYRTATERIKTKGLNGFGGTPTPAPVPDDSVYAMVTVDGKKYSGKLNME